VYKFV